MANLNKVMLMCPFCNCELWHLGNIWIKCFLCKRLYSKDILGILPIAKANAQLRQLKKLEESGDLFGEFFEENGNETNKN